jgi:hypothetical protein
MSEPKNPKTLVIKNEFYPDGLSEEDIWNYYQKVKIPLLRETLGKTLMVFFATNLNKNVVLRKNKSNQLIRLNYTDYDEIVNGRTLSFHLEMEKFSSYGIIDIDIDNFELAKETTMNVYETMIQNRKLIDDVKIIFTGKESFHIRSYFKGDYPIDYIRESLRDYLMEKNMDRKHTIAGKRTKNIPNLDLGRNHYKAAHICLHSLSVIGLRSMEIFLNRLKHFRKDMAKIK